MSSVNRVTLIGRLGRDPEVRYTQSGASVCTFSLATSESYKDKDGQKQEKTEWHRIVVWGKQAEVMGQHLTKGREIYLEGRIQSREFEKDGGKQRIYEIVASQVQFLGEKPKSSGPDTQAPYPRDAPRGHINRQAQSMGYDLEGSDVPF